MTVTANDVTQPLGELEKALFPGDSTEQFTDRIAGYLEDAGDRVDEFEIDTSVDNAIRSWVYYRAYHAKGTQLLAAPRQAVIEGQGSRSYQQEQADGFFALADRWKAVFDGLIPVENAADPAVKSSWFRHGLEW